MKIQSALLALLFTTGAPLATAQSNTMPMGDQPGMHASAMSMEMTNGEVRKIDKSAKKITIKHGEIKNLGMPPMTMVFKVKDSTMLELVKTGDKVQFVAEQINGALTITAIEPMK